jgi:resolvase/recombinase
MIYGYVRVSTEKQDLTRQITAIYEYADKKNLKIEKIFEDKSTGTNFNRDGYKELTDRTIEENDVIIITDLDRLGRNKEELKEEYFYITKKRKAKLIIINLPALSDLTMGGDNGIVFTILLELFTWLAEKELEQKKERIKTGIQNMEVKNGKKWSRKTKKFTGRPSIWEKLKKEKVIDSFKRGLKNKEIMELFKIKESTFFKIKNELKADNLI